MSISRTELFTSLGATLQDNGHCHFASDNSPVIPVNNFISPLSYYGLLQTAGPDSSKFLQGQTTCNFNEINDQQSRLGALCNPKGRMLSSFLAARRNDQDYLLRMRHDLLQSTQTTFSKYIVFSKAELADLSEQTLILGLHGDKAKAAITEAFGHTPNGINQVVLHNGQLVIQLDEQGLSFECWVEADVAKNYWDRLSRDLTPTGSNNWQLLNIQRGIGEVSAATLEAFIPQLLNFPTIGAVSFDKGCYTGQEIVARMHYRGKAKQAMYRIRFQGDNPEEGQELFSDGKQSIGAIVNVAESDASSSAEFEALAVLTHAETGKTIHRKNCSDKIEILDLPYAITTEST
jgi:folate-binding protein YgfZ